MRKYAVAALFGALGVQSTGLSADAAWHALWHHTMRGEGLLHPWPHDLMAAGFCLTWAAALNLLWSPRHPARANPTRMPRMH